MKILQLILLINYLITTQLFASDNNLISLQPDQKKSYAEIASSSSLQHKNKKSKEKEEDYHTDDTEETEDKEIEEEEDNNNPDNKSKKHNNNSSSEKDSSPSFNEQRVQHILKDWQSFKIQDVRERAELALQATGKSSAGANYQEALRLREEQEKAAITIQRTYRGYKTRKKLAKDLQAVHEEEEEEKEKATTIPFDEERVLEILEEWKNTDAHKAEQSIKTISTLFDLQVRANYQEALRRKQKQEAPNKESSVDSSAATQKSSVLQLIKDWIQSSKVSQNNITDSSNNQNNDSSNAYDSSNSDADDVFAKKLPNFNEQTIDYEKLQQQITSTLISLYHTCAQISEYAQKQMHTSQETITPYANATYDYIRQLPKNGMQSISDLQEYGAKNINWLMEQVQNIYATSQISQKLMNCKQQVLWKYPSLHKKIKEDIQRASSLEELNHILKAANIPIIQEAPSEQRNEETTPPQQ